MNPFLFDQLRQAYGLIVEDIKFPVLARYINMVTAFHPSIGTWKDRHDSAMRRSVLSSRCFSRRSRYAAAAVARHEGQFQLVLQIAGLLNACNSCRPSPHVLFASFNTYLAYTEWRPWAPLPSERAFHQWYELERSLYKQTDCILCTNRYVMRSFVNDYDVDPEKLHYIGYGANLTSIPDVPKNWRSPLALFVGYDFKRKGGPAVIEAFKTVKSQVPHARLRVIGPSTLEEKYMIDGVEFLGTIGTRSEMARHFCDAGFFVMPSVCEPFGLVFLEAMAYKNPCIGSTVDAMAEIIESEETGFLVPPGDVSALALRMKALYVDRDLRRRMGEASHNRVKQHFTWNACGGRVRAAIAGVLSSLQRT